MMAIAVTGVGSPLPLNREDMHLKYQLTIRWDCVRSQGKCTLNSLMSGEIHTWSWGGGYCTVALYTRGPGEEGTVQWHFTHVGLGRRVLYSGTLQSLISVAILYTYIFNGYNIVVYLI